MIPENERGRGKDKETVFQVVFGIPRTRRPESRLLGSVQENFVKAKKINADGEHSREQDGLERLASDPFTKTMSSVAPCHGRSGDRG